MATKKIVVVGAGGFAREVRWLISEINQVCEDYEFVGFVVSDTSKISEHDSIEDVLGDFSWIEKNLETVDAISIGIGSPFARMAISDQLARDFPGLESPALIHPTVRFHKESCAIGSGVIMCAGTIGTVGLKIEGDVLVNLSCTLGHEARLGRGCVVNPTVNISGGVNIGEGALIGTGAQIIQYTTIGDGAIVGAGAVVTRDVAPGATVVGVPAKPLRKNV